MALQPVVVVLVHMDDVTPSSAFAIAAAWSPGRLVGPQPPRLRSAGLLPVRLRASSTGGAGPGS